MIGQRDHAAVPAIERGAGARLTGEDGRSWLDLTAGLAVTSTGHCHPRVVAAIREQAGLLLHAQPALIASRPVERLADALAAVTPGDLDACFFANSGSEAIEAALKLARQSTGRPLAIAFRGGFHGRTYGAMAATTSSAHYRRGSDPLPAGWAIAPYPAPLRFAAVTGAPRERCLDAALAGLDELLETEAPPEQVAALLVEPVLGEGGYVVPPAGFLRALRERCDRHGILLVADEIQTGMLRTGSWFAVDHEGVVPDVLVTAKGLGSGMPIAAIAASEERMGGWIPRTHGGTYGGNPVCCAAAEATIGVLHELAPRLPALAQRLQDGLARIAAGSERIAEARGLGLMGALEFGDGRTPAPAAAAAVVAHAREHGVLLALCGTAGHVVRLMPPLVVREDELETGLAVLADGVAALS